MAVGAAGVGDDWLGASRTGVCELWLLEQPGSVNDWQGASRADKNQLIHFHCSDRMRRTFSPVPSRSTHLDVSESLQLKSIVKNNWPSFEACIKHLISPDLLSTSVLTLALYN